MRRLVLSLLATSVALGVIAGCSGSAQDGPGASSAAAPSTEVGVAPVGSVPSAPPSSATPEGAPKLAASGAPVADREAAVLRILRGDADAKQLSVEATDGGLPLDPTLRDKISPRAQPPRVKMGASTVIGKLPPEVVQRIVRQSFGRFRLCYDKALEKDPALTGKVEVKLTIDRAGAVSNVSEGASTIQDATMRACVTNAFRNLSFPQPEAGIVTVTCPISFEPPVE